MSDLASVFDVFFNGRRAPKSEQSTVTVAELVSRGTSVILYKGKLYHVAITEAEVTKRK